MAKIYVKRDIEGAVKKAAKQFPAVIITGPRQSGKTTLLKHLFAKTHNYVSLDDPDIRLMAVGEPKLFLKNYPPPLIIDEIQYAPELFPFLKIAIDNERSKNGRFLLTGSQSFPLMANVGESLAGRIAVFTLLSLSLKEQLTGKDISNLADLRHRTLKGGFPEVVLTRNVDTGLWFGGYFQTYLERDVRQLRQIGDLMDFQRFLELLAAYNGQVLNLSGLSNDLGVAVNTVKAWISVLEACNQIILIKPFYKNKGKRIIKSPKVYFLDTGFLCYLLGITHKEQVFKGPAAGQLFETVVLGEVIKNFYNNGEIPRIFWWRTSYGEEVDFIIERNGKIFPVEVKMSSKTNKDSARGLFSFYKIFKDNIKKCILVNLSDKKMILGNKIECQPFMIFIKSEL
ncbi:MAG: ATP-binding protein [bacterium]